MREIRFRAWDKSTNKMCNDFLYFVEDAIYQHQGNPWQDTRFVPMQFTGLKDKEGKEIFEGDILETPYGKLKVEWVNGGWVLGDTDWLYAQAEESEVIGNVWENPDLLSG